MTAAYSEVENPLEILGQDPGLSGGSSIEDAIKNAGFQVQAVNWVWQKIVGEDLVSSIITPITGDFEKIAAAAAQWNNVCAALQAVRKNINAGAEELQPSWSGPAAESFANLIGITWTVGLEADAQAAKLIGVALSKVADGSKRACDQVLKLIERLVNKLIEAAAMLPIPVVGWGRAVKLVYDGIQIYNAIMDLIEGIKSIIDGATQVVNGIMDVGTALSKLGSADSISDLMNIANDVHKGVTDIRDGGSQIRDGATQASSAAGDLRTSTSSASENARGLVDERASAREQNTASSSSTDTATSGTGNGNRPGRSNALQHSGGDGEGLARPQDPETTRTPEQNRVCENDPVDVSSGEVVLSQTDVELPGALPLVIKRTHVSSYRAGRFYGRSWASTFDQRLEFDDDGVVFVADDGMVLVYPRVPEEGEVLPVTGPRWPLAATADGWCVTDRTSGRILHFAAGDNPVRRLTAVTDRNGNRFDLDRDAVGCVTAVRHSGGYHIEVDTDRDRITELRLRHRAEATTTTRLVRYRYDDAGLLAEVVNSSGRSLRFSYDDQSRLVRWTDRNGHWYHYFYDDAGRCVANHSSSKYLSGTFSYDPDNRITRFTDALGHSTVYQLDAKGNVIAETDPLGHTTTSEWDEHNRLISRTDPLGRTTRYSYDDDGNLTGVSGPDGTQSRAEYNEWGLPTSVVDPDGAVWRQSYDERGNRVSLTDPTGATTRYSYDERGNATAITDALGQTRRIEYDPAGLPLAVTDPSGATRRFERDHFGRITAIIDEVGAVTRFGWTVEGKRAWRTLPDGTTERWEYDGEGNEIAYVGPSGLTRRISYTQFDLPVSVTDAEGNTLTYTYDPLLRLTAVTNAHGLTWRYERDAAGNVVREIDYDGREIRYFYDAAGQLTSRVNGAGETTTFRRDLSGRVVERRAQDRVSTFEYDPMGRMLSATSPDATVRYRRDARGRVLSEQINGHTVTSRYDALGRRVHRRTSTGVESTWSYDVRGCPRELRMADRMITFGFDGAGREIERRLDNGATIAQQWDRNGRLIDQSISIADGAPTVPPRYRLLQQRSYRYGPDGSPQAVDDTSTGTVRLQLDGTGRVRQVAGPGGQEQYSYDRAGNIRNASWHTPSGHGQHSYAYDGTRLTTAGNVRYTYDRQGRVVTKVRYEAGGTTLRWHYTWNAEDRLVEVGTPDGSRWRYLYDALGRRIAKHKLAPDGSTVVERTEFIWDGVRLAEQVLAGVDATTWEWHPRRFRPLTQIRRRLSPAKQWVGGDFHAVITDGIGTSTELLDGSGNLAWRNRTTLWGKTVIKHHGSASTPWRFPGQYSDPETGLHYNYHRYYDPDTGRYVSCDPLGLRPSPNHYAYVVNPLRWLDPLGLMSCGDDDAVTLYRNVDGREFDAIAETGRFESGGGSSEGKWFALHGEHADRWGEVLNQGDGVTMETNVPSSVVDGLHRHPGDNLDGIGPAVYADADQLEQINQQGDGIRIWEGSNSGHA